MTKFSYVEALQVAEHSEATKSIAESVRAAVEGKNYVRSSGKIARSVALPENKSFVLLPNPATETTQIVLQDPTTPHTARLYAQNGQLLQTIPINGTTSSFSVADLPSGIYHIRLDNTGMTEKLIVIH